MALGISERMIQRAFGAQDLSPIYNTISAANNRIMAEEAARRKEAEKRYYAELSEINKQRAGIREADIGRVTGMYNNWSKIEKALSSNPSLITENPQEYGKLKSESNRLYSQMLTTIQGSKEFAQFEKDTYRKIVDPNNLDDWDEGADAMWKANVMSRPIDEIRQNNLDDMSIYRRKDVDGSKFYQSLPTSIASISKFEPEVKDDTYKERDGTIKVFKYKNLIPSLDAARSAVELDLNAAIPQRAIPKFAKQELDKAIESGDYAKTISDFNAIYNTNKDKFKLPPVPEDAFSDALPPRAKFINYLAAKQFVNNYANPTFKSDFVTDPAAAEAARRAYAKKVSDENFQRTTQRMMQMQRNTLAATQKMLGGTITIDPLFKNASAAGAAGDSGMLQASESFNSIGFDEQMFPFTAYGAGQGSDIYNIGSSIVAGEKNKAIRNNAKIDNPNSKEGKEQAKKLAAAINESNKNRDFYDSDITPEALLAGRVIVMTKKDKDGNNVNTYLNVTGNASRKYMNRKIKPPQLTEKGKRASIGESLMSGTMNMGEGTADDYGL